MAVYKSVWSSVYAGLRKTGRRLLGSISIASLISGGAVSGVVRQMANNTPAPHYSALSAAQGMSRTEHYNRGGATQTAISITLPNNLAGYNTVGNAITFKAAVEYPAGTLTPLTFGGASTKTGTDGGIVTSDMVTLATPIPNNAVFWIRVYAIGASGYLPYTLTLGSINDRFTYGATVTDQTAGGTVVNTDSNPFVPNGGHCLYPMLIRGNNVVNPAILSYGDSRDEGDFDVGDTSGDVGRVARQIGGSLPYVRYGIPGLGLGYIASQSSQFAACAALGNFTHAIMGGGINDIVGGATDANLRTVVNGSSGSFVSIFGPLIPKLYLTTMEPFSSSATGWASPNDQTDRSPCSVSTTDPRKTHNDWRRTIPAGFAGYFDLADVMETARDSGSWYVGSGGPYTNDGLHCNVTGYARLAASASIPVSAFTGSTPVPANSAAPTISGTPQVGQTLTATTGTWSGSPTGYTYQWNRAGAAISGATASTYVPVSADVGNTLTVSVIASNAGGAGTAATSAATSAITAAAASVPVNSAVPTISGTPQTGQTLTATSGTWSNSPTSYAYQWNRAGTAISGATSSTYAPVTADVGNTLTVTVIASNGAGAGTAATSAATAAVTAAAAPATPRNLTMASGTTYDTTAEEFGSGAFTPGSSSYGTQAANVQPSTGIFTMEMWFKTSSAAQQIMLGQNSNVYLQISAGKLSANIGNGGAAFNFGGTGLANDGSWHHLALVCGASGSRLYLDGVLYASTTKTWSTGNPILTNTLSIGNFLGQYTFVGELDEVAIWNTERYTANFTPPTAPYTGNEAGLWNLYHFDGNGNDSVA